MIGMCDMHCHILPGVDDGAADMDMALALLEMEYRQGVRNIIMTPHYRVGMFETPIERIQRTFIALRERVHKRDLNLYLGCEYHVNMEITERLFSERYRTLAGSRYVLCEFSSISDASFIRERSYRLVSSGFIPILAHIERYSPLRKNLDFVEELAHLGCRMQVNADSVLGKGGFGTKRFCKKLLEYDWLDFIGSDCHDLSHRVPRMDACSDYLEKKIGKQGAKRILCDNPLRVIQNG